MRPALRLGFKEARSRRRQLASAVLLGAGAVLAAVGLLTTSGYLISRAAQRPEILALSAAIVGVRFFGISRALLRYAERLVSHDLAFRTLTDLRRRFFRRLVHLGPAGLDGVGRGELLGRFVADVDRLQDLFLRGLIPPMIALLAGAGSVLVAFLILPAAAAALAAFLLIAAIAAPGLTRRAAAASGRRQGPARAALGAHLVEITSGSAELAVAGRAEEWIERCEQAGGVLTSLARRDAVSAGLAVGLATTLAALATVAVLAAAIPAVGTGALSGVLLAALALLTIGAFEAVGPLPAAATSIDACDSAVERIEEIVDREPVAGGGKASRPPGPGPLELRGVRFRYGAEDDWVLDGVDLTLTPGRSVALLGPSGAGKSSLAKIAVGFRWAQAGEVRLGGVPLREIEMAEITAAVRLSPQDAYLFTTTLGANVALGRPDATAAEIRAALDGVGLGPCVDSLPEGLETEVGEAGAKVSGGQRGRIAAARLLLARPRFLIFDEPTAHLDHQGAVELQRHLAGLTSRGFGVLVITHDRGALDAFDEVLELRGGRIVRP